jgi:hypothetical protein
MAGQASWILSARESNAERPAQNVPAELTGHSRHDEVSAMKTYKLCLLVAASTCICSIAQAQSPESAPRGATAVAPTRNMNSASQETGTILKKSLKWSSKIPVDKTYGQMSPEQRAGFHALYAKLAPGDEPPFPAEGMKSMFYKIRRAQHLRQARGELKMSVTVGPDGKATKVEDFGGVNDIEMSQFVQSLLLMTTYKPAMCSGQPCSMQFPFDLKLSN